MIKIQGRLFRAALAIGNAIVLDAATMNGAWAVTFATISTYLIFTAVSGECIVREYLFRPLDATRSTKVDPVTHQSS
jgi:hypothetical protein